MSNNWGKTLLGDLIDIKHGFAFPGKGITNIENKNLLVTPGNFEIGGGFQSSKNKYFIGEVDEKFLLSHGEIIVSMTDLSKEGDTLGYSAKIPNNSHYQYLHNQRIGKVVFLNNNFHPDFIYWLMRSKQYRHWILSSATGSTVKHTSPKRIRDYEFLLPPPSEQKKISNTLSKIEEKIELNQKTNETLEGITNSLFKSWFIDFDPVRAKAEGRSTGLPDEISDLFPDTFEDSELGNVPVNWEYKKIGDVFQTILGGTPSRKKSEYWEGNIPWIGSGMVNAFRVIKETEFITELGLENSSTKMLPKRSTLIAITGATLGQISINEIEVCTNQSVVAIKPCKEISPEYVFLWVQKNVNYLINSQTGGAQQHINKNNVNEMKILLPNKEVMEFFSVIVKPIFDRISINLFESDNLSILRNQMLPKLISGELRIPDVEKMIDEVGI